MRERRIVLTVVGGLILLGVLSFGLGWVTHALYAVFGATGSAPETVATATPEAGAQELPSTPTPSPTLDVAAPTPRATSTLQAASTSSPLDLFLEVIQSDGGLYGVCRRFCDGLWPDGQVPHGLDAYARRVAKHNGIPWPDGGPELRVGQKLEMLPCPEE